MSIENTINKFRIVLIICVIIGDVFGFEVKNIDSIYKLSDYVLGLLMIVIILTLVFFTNKLTKSGNYYGWLKYFTVFIDLSICYLLSLVYTDVEVQTYLNNGDIAIILTLLLITFNALSTLRVSRNVVLLSSILTSLYIAHTLYALNMSIVTIIYVVILVVFISAVNIWLAKNVFNSLILQIETQKLNEEISIQKQELETKNQNHRNSMSYASRIQQALLPSHENISSQIPEYFILYKPKDIVSGDFFWFKDLGNYWAFVAADCTGHGVPGAFMSVMGISFLNEIIQNKELTTPSEILNTLRDKVKESFLNVSDKQRVIKDGMDVALCLFDKNTNTIHYSGAYNPLLIVRNNVVIELKADRQPVGSYLKEKPFSSEKIQVSKGDCIYMYSDGFADQIGGTHNKKYMSRNFKGFIAINHNKCFETQKELLENEFENWKSTNSQIDDVLVVGFKIM